MIKNSNSFSSDSGKNTPELNPELVFLHTEREKKLYGDVEREIKRTLTGDLMLSRMFEWIDPSTGNVTEPFSRWLSITQHFDIRELAPEENDRHKANPTSVKSDYLTTTQRSNKLRLFDLIDKKVKDEMVAAKFKEGIHAFYEEDINQYRRPYLSANPMYKKFVWQYCKQYIKKEISIEKLNAVSKLWELIWFYFKDEWLTQDEQGNIVVSQKVLVYIANLLLKAVWVWKDWGGNMSQIFHDGDFPFVLKWEVKNFESYVDVLVYLLSHDKINDHGKRGKEWIEEWTRKTGQFADVLWACTNPVFWLSEPHALKNLQEEFQWGPEVQRVYDLAREKFNTEVKLYNQKSWNNFASLSRLKTLPSCVEKTIESKPINDIIWLRVSIENTNTSHFKSIMEIATNWASRMVADLDNMYGDDIEIERVELDNKWVITKEQLQEAKKTFSEILPGVDIRKSPKPSYVPIEEWEHRMKINYPSVYQNEEKYPIILEHYKNTSWGASRWHNGVYKDFKINLYMYLKVNGKRIPITIELQFYDDDNNIWLASPPIRNSERSISTASNSVFSKPLNQVRKTIEVNLKKMASSVENKGKKMQEIDFGDWEKTNVSSFVYRTEKNGVDIDKAVVNIINYFVKQGKFLFFSDKNQKNLRDNLVFVPDLYNANVAEGLQICTSWALSKHQYSYQHANWDDKIGIYMRDKKTIWWLKMKEIINYMNLWKIKDQEHSFDPSSKPIQKIIEKSALRNNKQDQ